MFSEISVQNVQSVQFNEIDVKFINFNKDLHDRSDLDVSFLPYSPWAIINQNGVRITHGQGIPLMVERTYICALICR